MIGNQSLQIFFKTFEKYPLDQVGLNVYALADAAQDKTFLKVLEHLRQKCLLTEAGGEKAREISPHLLQLPKDFTALEWEWIEKNIAGTTKMTIIISPLSFDYLYKHLRQFLDVEFDGGLEMMLAFWDPAILATLVGHKADVTISSNQKWGTSSAGVNYHKYFHNWKLFNLGINASTDIRITGGLSFNISLFGALTRDQINLPKGGATEQEILTRRRQIASGYSYYTSIGLNYRFGSRLSNFVNPRFEGPN